MKTSLLIILFAALTQSCATTTYNQDLVPRTPAVSSQQPPAQVVVAPGTNPTTPPAHQSNGGSGRDATSIPADQAALANSCKQKMDQDLTGRSIDPNNLLIAHQAYKLSYNFNYRVANWVYHEVKKSNLEYSCAKRNDKFKADPVLSVFGLPRVTEKDYKGSVTGYDRGHMAPSGDFRWNPEVDGESFLMTNMSPQTKNLNQRAWNRLEEKVRAWACGLGEVKIYTGPVLNNQTFPRLESCVAIPNQFYKVVVAYKNGGYQGIGFIYNQSDDGDPIQERAVSIRQVEKATGIDFFKDQFAQEVQDTFETQNNLNDWVSVENNCTRCSRTSGDGVTPPTNDGN